MSPGTRKAIFFGPSAVISHSFTAPFSYMDAEHISFQSWNLGPIVDSLVKIIAGLVRYYIWAQNTYPLFNSTPLVRGNYIFFLFWNIFSWVWDKLKLNFLEKRIEWNVKVYYELCSQKIAKIASYIETSNEIASLIPIELFLYPLLDSYFDAKIDRLLYI